MNADDLQCFLSAFIRFHRGYPLHSRWKDYEMRKGFTRKPQPDAPATPVKNYITPSGLEHLKDEHRFLLTRERPAVTEVVAWAASNSDRSENADYQYGKRRLRQIDGRIRFLTKRIEAAEVVKCEISCKSRHFHEVPGWRNWQTQRTQNPPTFGSWGFDSPSRHQQLTPSTGLVALTDTGLTN